MTHSSQNLNESYGYLTWLNGQSSFMLPQTQFVFPGSINPDAPSDMYAAMGKNGQVLNVVPSDNLIWIRMGDAPGGSGGLIGPVFNNNVWQHINELKCGSTGISESTDRVEVKIWPNPSKNLIHIQSRKSLSEILIYNLNGNLCEKRTVNKKNVTINHELRPGLYLAQLHYIDGYSTYSKFSVE